MRRHGPSIIDMEGQTFGRLTVLTYVGPSKGGSVWECACACGAKTQVRGYRLRVGSTTSCGCASREITIARSTTHGGAHRPEYSVWQGMLNRCRNRNNRQFKDYGGRGITVCASWYEFDNFFRDMGARPTGEHTLDRIDNSIGYSPGNCRWATREMQSKNTRRTVWVVVNGSRVTSKEAAKILNVSYGKFSARLRRGWTVQRAAGANPRARWVTLPDVSKHRLGDVARMCGLSPRTIFGRIARGWPVERIGEPSKAPAQHGRSGTSEYWIWTGMRARCENTKHPHYGDYGGRGIRVCARWHKFENFFADMGLRPSKKHSVERLNNNQGYSPENCRWATRTAQARNTRKTRWVSYNGTRMSFMHAIEASKMPYELVRRRLLDGWSDERALSEPKNGPSVQGER